MIKGVNQSDKGSSFGFGDKVDLSKKTLNVPGPGAYSVPSTLRVEESSKILDSRFMNPSSIKIHNSLDISRRK